jgi:hypothetical protein
MLKFTRLVGIWSSVPMLLFRPFGSEGTSAKFCYVLPSDDILVHGDIRGGEYHEGRIGGLAMEVRISVMLRDLLGVLGFAAVICKWGRKHM